MTAIPEILKGYIMKLTTHTDHIKKVHVIFKTHLDVGFTDTAENVLQKYVKVYIPRAIELADELNRQGRKQFVWTVGAYLIDHYLRCAGPEQCRALETAVGKGDITWHGMAFTTHTELMDRRLLDFSLSISDQLDRRFHKKTIGAKMTDVPGHTIGMVPVLAKHDIGYLHIGVNCGSPMPRVPSLFRWKNGPQEIIVHYADDYGKGLVLDEFDEAVEYACTGDNTGPQSREQILCTLEQIKRKYPCAQVEASDIQTYARRLFTIKDRLPVVTEEIGDTWIHGCGTDPYKVGCYCELLDLKERWLAEGRLSEESEEYRRFMTALLLIAEHTWSMDLKKYLFDFVHWDKAGFMDARRRDITTLADIPSGYDSLKRVTRHELDTFRDGQLTGSYRRYEASQDEQRGYITQALEALPADLRQEGCMAIASLRPFRKAVLAEKGKALLPGQYFEIGPYRGKINGRGALDYLRVENWEVVRDAECAAFSYEVFDAATVKDTLLRYNVRLDEHLDWIEADFGKPGLERVSGLRHRLYAFAVTEMRIAGRSIFVSLAGDEQAAEKYGCPRAAEIVYHFDTELKIELRWYEKAAVRIPEALWLGYQFHVENPYLWRMRKIDTLVSPYQVVSGGNRKQHGCREWRYAGADGDIVLRSRHCALVSVGSRNLYSQDDRVDDLANGFYYTLWNNRWGTNYRTWYDEEGYFAFTVGFSPSGLTGPIR